MGWDGSKNGELLAKAQIDFDVFVTGDRNLTFQQDLNKVRSGGGCASVGKHATRISTPVDSQDSNCAANARFWSGRLHIQQKLELITCLLKNSL